MRKTRVDEVKRIEKITDSITCNMCGREMKTISLGLVPHNVFENVLRINHRWEESRMITDDPKQKYKSGAKTYSLDICWECFNKILSMCKIPPEVFDF